MNLTDIFHEEIFIRREWAKFKEFDLECGEVIYKMLQKYFTDSAKYWMMGGELESKKRMEIKKYVSPYSITYNINQTLTTGYRITPTIKNDE